MERNVRLPVRINGDYVVLLVCREQELSAVRDDRIQVRAVHIEVLSPHLDYLPVNLDAVSLRFRIHLRVHVRHRSRRQPYNRYVLDWRRDALRAEEGREEKVVPGPTGE